MERKKTIQELINALKVLSLQKADLTEQLEQAIAENNCEQATYEAVAIASEEREVRRDTRREFSRGDRIWIINKLHKPANWDNNREWTESEGKTATVTEVLIKGPNKQVHFVTDNGVRTWRAPNNVRLLQTR